MLTKAQAIANHRTMWNWIAQTSIQKQRCVEKYEAFAHFGWGPVKCLCWCCEYGDRINELNMCLRCPITHCLPYFEPWRGACDDNDYIAAARYAYQLAELHENPEA